MTRMKSPVQICTALLRKTGGAVGQVARRFGEEVLWPRTVWPLCAFVLFKGSPNVNVFTKIVACRSEVYTATIDDIAIILQSLR